MFVEWRTELEHRVRSGEEAPMLESHFAKYRSLVPSLALLIHLADIGTGPVGKESLVRAWAWAEYVESHARRVYAPALSPAAAAARRLADRILKRDLEQEFSLRDVQRKQWSGLQEHEEIVQGLALLAALEWVHVSKEPTGGRPTTRCIVNPKVFARSDGDGKMA